MDRPTIFISYSHKDERWKNRLVAHLGVLEQVGLIDIWNETRVTAGADWYEDIRDALDRADSVVMLVSADYLASSFIQKEEAARLFQRRSRERVPIYPLIVRPCLWQAVEWISQLHVWPEDGKALSACDKNQREVVLFKLAEHLYERLRFASPHRKPQDARALDPNKIFISRLPVTSSHLFGRDRELKLLNECWDNHVNILTLVGPGGSGKSALVNHWLRRMSLESLAGPERIYAWSFYQQGSTDGAASADLFIDSALRWFGDSDPTAGSPWQKGERLAYLIRAHRTLLILDGVEGLQYPPGPQEGKLKDQALQALLREMASQNNGLCVISSRQPLRDLDNFEGGTTRTISINTLPPKAGVELLKALGLRGEASEMEQVCREFNGNPLTLSLLASYLNDVFDGDIRKRSELTWAADGAWPDDSARRIIAAYERWFGDGPEICVLRMMGLFAGPANGHAVAALREPPAITGLTDQLQSLSERQWQQVLTKLRRARLLIESTTQSDALDTHQLVRKHFSQQLKDNLPDAWRVGNWRLFEHLRKTSKELPDNIEEMAPLYDAVAYGCKAGHFSEALDEIYWQRIQRGIESFSLRRLGAVNANLTALSYFFESSWRQPVSELAGSDQGFVLNEAGFLLRALGQLAEATQPLEASLEKHKSRGDLQNAIRALLNLRELRTVMGDLTAAMHYAIESITLVRQTSDLALSAFAYSGLGQILHMMGRFSEAAEAFNEAEEIQRQPGYSAIHTGKGFLFCALLLDQGKYREVLERAAEMLEWARTRSWLLEIALSHFYYGRAFLLQAQQENADTLKHAEVNLEDAVIGLRQAGQQDYLPLGLLARAELRIETGALDSAQADLDEAMVIALRGGMDLHRADCHLLFVKLYLARGDTAKANEHLMAAKEMIERMGYHRRDKEVLLFSFFDKIELLQHKDSNRRREAIRFLGESGLQGVLPMLIGLIEDEDQGVREAAEQAIEKLPARDWSDRIHSIITTRGEVSFADLPQALLAEQIAALVKYKRTHSTLDLIYMAGSKGLCFRDRSRIEKLQQLWGKATTALSLDQNSFCGAALEIADYFSSCLDLPGRVDEHSDYIYGRFSMVTIDASPAIRDVPVHARIPMLFLKDTRLLESDLDDLRYILNQVLKQPGRLVFLVLFIREEEMAQARKLLDEELRQVFAYNTCVFDHERVLSIIGAKQPLQALKDFILSEIDLVSVSPFRTDGPTSDQMFFGRENEMWEISEHANTASFALIGGRKVGKTSILQQLKRRRLPRAGFMPFYFTCERMDQREPTKKQFLEAVAAEWAAIAFAAPPNSFADLVKKLSGDTPPVFLIDEVDRLIPEDRRMGWPLFGEMRALAQAGRCQFVFSGERVLRDAVMEDSTGRLYNFPKAKKIGCLDYADTGELVTRPMKGLKIELTDEAAIIQRVWNFTGGHPNVVQRLCQKLIERLNQRQTRSITAQSVDEVISDPQFQYGDFLVVFWEQATILERIISLVMARGSGPYSLKDVRQALKESPGVNLEPKAREVQAALKRLVELRSILESTPQGYVLAISAFPDVINQAITVEDTLAVLIEDYNDHGDVVPSVC